MLYYDRINISEEIDINKTSKSKEYDTCCYWYFLDKGFRFQQFVCNVCHDLSTMSVSLSHTAILNIHNPGYPCIISRISIIETINVNAKQ